MRKAPAPACCWRKSAALYEPLNKTFAEVTEEEKNQISHRARACEKMLEIMKGLHE